MKRLLKWLGILLLILLLIVLLALGAVGFLAGTERGFNLATREAAKRVDGLELGAFRGSLASGIGTDALSFESDALKVEARGVDTAWRLGCLTERRFCLDRAIVDELDVTTFATDAPPPEAPAGDIELPSVRLPIDVTAEEVLVRRLTFQPPGDAPPQVLENVRLSARTEDGTLVLDEAALDYGTYSARVSGTVTPDGDYPIDLDLVATLDDVVPEGEGFGDVRDVRVELALDNTLRELDVAADVSGPASARLEGRVEPLDKDLPLAVELVVPEAGWPLDTRALARARDLRVTVDGTLEDYALGVTTNLDGEQVPATAIDLAGRANTERLLLSDIDVGTLGGTVAGSAALSWADGIAWLASIDLADIDPSVQVETIAGSLDGAIRASGGVAEDGDWTLDLRQANVEGVLQGYPFTLDAVVEKRNDGVFRIETLTLDNGANRVDARGTVGDAWDITGTVRLPELQNFVPDLAGGFDADLALTGPLAEPDVTLDASASVLTLNDLVVEGFSLKADIDRAALAPSSLTLAVGQVRAGEQTVANIRLGLDGTRAEHTLALFADGPEATAIELEAAGGLNDAFDWLGSLEAVTLELPAHVVTLAEPTALAWDNAGKQFAVDPHCWVTEETNLCLENRVLAEASGTAVISLDTYPLNRLNPFLPAETTLSGALGADATIEWGEAQPGGFAASVALAIDDGGATVIDANEDPVSFTYDSVTLDADVDPTDVEATLTVSSETLGEARVAVQLDPAEEPRTLAGRLDLTGFRIDFAKAFLPDFDEISGTVNASGDLSGTLTDPRFDGEIVLAEPVVRADTLPLPITGGEIVTNVRGRRAFIEGALESAGDGRIAIDGSANWQQSDAWRADVTLSGEALEIRQEPLNDSRVSHEITIGARPGSIRVGGNVDIPYARIDVAELPQGAATLSDDIVIVEDIDEEAEELTVDPPGSTALRVDVDVSLGDDVALDAYGLTANLTGDMSVSLRSPDPVQLGGEIRVVDGIFKQYGQNLEASGQILFVGPVDRTALDIQAIRRIETEDPERIAGLKITGDVAEPDISLFTEPADKSEEAILSYVVLGRDLGETSDQSASLLASAALALSVRGGRTIGSGVADRLGIDDFALETRGRGNDTELVVSGRVNERLLLSYGQSVFESGPPTLSLRYDLTKQLYLEAAQGVNEAIDLIYQFSF